MHDDPKRGSDDEPGDHMSMTDRWAIDEQEGWLPTAADADATPERDDAEVE